MEPLAGEEEKRCSWCKTLSVRECFGERCVATLCCGGDAIEMRADSLFSLFSLFWFLKLSTFSCGGEQRSRERSIEPSGKGEEKG
jgi:hypothetical protein